MKPKTSFSKALFSWLPILKLGTRSIQTNADNVTQSRQNSQQDSRYNNESVPTCETLVYAKFLKIIITEDTSLLQCANHEQAWANILQEYIGAIKTEKSQSIFKLWNKISQLTWRLTFIEECLRFLKDHYDAEIAAEMVKHGFDNVEDLQDRAAYLQQLYMIETESKTMIVLLNQYTNEYIAMQPPGGYVKPTMARYDKELAILSMFMKYKIDKHTYTVSEVIGIMNLYLEHNGRAII